MSKLDKIDTKVRPYMARLPDFVSILVVEDQRFDRTRLRRLIANLEIETHIVDATCLEQMGTMLEADAFDLILLDYNLPDGNGLQALDAVQHSAKNRTAATIMITGDDQTQTAIEALKRGCSDYITKDDLTVDGFKRAVINSLQKSRLSIGMETQDVKRRQMEAVLRRFSSECAREIKPVLSRMMRQMRDLRDAVDTTRNQADEQHAKIEQSCMRLWDFLTDLEDYEGQDLASDSFGPSIAWSTDVLRQDRAASFNDGPEGTRSDAGQSKATKPKRVMPQKSKTTFRRPER